MTNKELLEHVRRHMSLGVYRYEIIREDVKALVKALEEAEAKIEGLETPWEYGFTSKWGTHARSHRFYAEQDALALRRSIKEGKESGNLKYHGLMKKRRAKRDPGPWIALEEGE